MMVLVSMLRAVNLASYNRVRMAELTALYESLGLRDVETYVQSGNLVFRAPERGVSALPRRIEEAIEKRFGIRTAAVHRTAAELRSVVARNPFAGGDCIEPRKLLVHFLAGDPGEAARAKVLALPPAPEEARVDGREVYIYFVNGMARPKLSMAQMEKALGVAGTGRNWNTVTRLLEMAEGLEERNGSGAR